MNEVHTIDNFVAEAMKHEAVKKTLDYYNKMAHHVNPRQKPTIPRDTPKPTFKKVSTTFVHRPHPKPKPKDVVESWWLFIKPKEHNCRDAQGVNTHNKQHVHPFCSNMKCNRPNQPNKES